MAQSEVGFSDWKSIARLVMSGAPPTTLGNLEDRVPSALSRTHNCIKSPSPEPIDCRWTIRSAPAMKASRRMPIGGWTGNISFEGLLWASNGRLRTSIDKGTPTV
ncbi:Hypothetical predicted protein [Olea europaea subsp. europaea]|uniref:Uncharacterized protein n=1 Tax=Olea europaea subsp. europaea TaxID=158383 RepID=A0A8S0TDC4_OLEEU|nr:Hypothetical predicted protein [Olea europaea subsp. europaea]